MKLRKITLLFVLLPFTLLAQKARSYQDVVSALTTGVVQSPSTNKPVRLAVVPFKATAASSNAAPRFGAYLTETIIGELGNHPEQVRLFERTRLDAVLKEQEFILTDLMKPAAALKIGQLVPIDAVLSGTYTRLKSYIDVSARLIDVASGEITFSFNGRIKVNRNIETLFTETVPIVQPSTPPTNQTAPTAAPTTPKAQGDSQKEVCKRKAEAVQALLHDLSTPARIDAAAAEAMKTPFDNMCGRLHFDVMSVFARYKVKAEGYNSFLRKTLDTLAYPPGDERALEIVHYFAADNEIDAIEWPSIFAAISKTGNYSLSSYISTAIARVQTNQVVAQKRIDEYMNLARTGKLGLPRPVSLEVAFAELMEGLRHNPLLGEFAYASYHNHLQPDERMMGSLFSELTMLYKAETDLTRKSRIQEWIADFVNEHEYAKLHEQLFDYVRNWDESPYRDKSQEYATDDIRILTQRCSAALSRLALASPYPSQRDERIAFCVIHGIAIPGVIPTPVEAKAILNDHDLNKQYETLRLLEKMKTPPSEIHNELVALLFRKSLENRELLNNIQTLSITLLGRLRTSDQRAIQAMLDALPHYGNDTEAAKVALAQIGKPAVPLMVKWLDKTTDQDGGLQYQLIVLLGGMGKDATAAEKAIVRVGKINQNKDVQYAVDAALQAIRGN